MQLRKFLPQILVFAFATPIFVQADNKLDTLDIAEIARQRHITPEIRQEVVQTLQSLISAENRSAEQDCQSLQIQATAAASTSFRDERLLLPLAQRLERLIQTQCPAHKSIIGAMLAIYSDSRFAKKITSVHTLASIKALSHYSPDALEFTVLGLWGALFKKITTQEEASLVLKLIEEGYFLNNSRNIELRQSLVGGLNRLLASFARDKHSQDKNVIMQLRAALEDEQQDPAHASTTRRMAKRGMLIADWLLNGQRGMPKLELVGKLRQLVLGTYKQTLDTPIKFRIVATPAPGQPTFAVGESPVYRVGYAPAFVASISISADKISRLINTNESVCLEFIRARTLSEDTLITSTCIPALDLLLEDQFGTLNQTASGASVNYELRLN